MVKRLGHVVDDGEALWLLSSAAEIGFRVKGATQVKLVLGSDDTVLDPAAETVRPRFAVRLDGEKILDRRMADK